MDAKQFREQLEKQNKQFDAAMKQLEALGNVAIALPEEILGALEAALEARRCITKPTSFGVRA